MNTKLGLIGKKLGMGHIYDDKGVRHPVTYIQSLDCRVAGVRQAEKDGYAALQLAVGVKKEQRTRKPVKGQFKELDQVPQKVREFRLDTDTCQKYKVGDAITVDIFEKGQFVDVCGKTMGKGFQGVMRRYGFGGFIATHGTHESFRGGGSVGARTWPGRIYKGRKMPGHMGNVTRTTMSIRILDIDPKNQLLILRGSVSGPKNRWLEVRLANKK